MDEHQPAIIKNIQEVSAALVGAYQGIYGNSSSIKSNVDIQLSFGELNEKSSVSLSYASDYSVSDFRSECNASSEELLFVLTFPLSSDGNGEEIGTLLSRLLPPLFSALPFQTLTHRIATVTDTDGRRVVRVVFAINDSELQILEGISTLLDLVELNTGEILKFIGSHGIGDDLDDHKFKLGARLKCQASRNFIQVILNVLNRNDNDEDLKSLIKLVYGFKNFEFKLEFDEVEEAVKRFVIKMFPERKDNWKLTWKELKEVVVGPLTVNALMELKNIEPPTEESEAGEKEAEEYNPRNAEHLFKKLPQFYKILMKNIVGLSKISLVLGKHMFSINITGLDLISSLLPQNKEDIQNIIDKQNENGGVRLNYSKL